MNGGAAGDAKQQALLSVRGLSVSYGKVQAVRGVDLEVPRGSIVTVIGPNGAGKTTLLGAVMGLLRAGGQVLFEGRDLARADAQQRVEAGIGLVTEKRDLFGSMSVHDNLLLGSFRRRDGRAARQRELERVYELFPRLKERRAQAAQTLSGGERQMLALGRALMGAPRLLMLDEPSLGLAPRIVREVLHAVAQLRDAGMSVLLIEQNARAALQVADFGYVLELGEVSMHGPAQQLLHDPKVEATYLGMLKE
ncbi:ABC transporter ATP-binding protein [Thiomonas sp. FB-6]|uniref:ABC transporter ATP-binding protein n=1 Tax=Thiomonas sp. FB-6 TaxID=1158291 RepID=UPI0003822998|nr:ABC transporter ATP-binding protein [Thiomonas sp. FB-6]